MILVVAYGFRQYYDFLRENRLHRKNFIYTNVNDLDLHFLGRVNTQFISLVHEEDISTEIKDYCNSHNIKQITTNELEDHFVE